jgi:bifunctional UDP-N-acetylglucosamine pyrophosphorylase/glucosamine-1-phosphate N-acetyltransferase
MADRVAIILAAGISSRMKTKTAKVLHEVCGRAMLGDQVRERFGGADDIVWVEQAQQKGTGHAVLCCKEQLSDFEGQTLVVCGDGPLIRAETLEALIAKHEEAGSAATLATAVLDDPTGYGRIVRDGEGNVAAIVEHNDCSDEQLGICEVNPSYYIFDNQVLFETLADVTPDNAKNEYYVTPEEAIGVNSRVQLSEVGKIMQRRIQEGLMLSGVTIVDPDSTWIDTRAEIGIDSVIEPFTYVEGAVRIDSGCRVGPFAYLKEGATVTRENVEEFGAKGQGS